VEGILLGENLYRHQDKLVDVYNIVRTKVNSLRRCMLGGSTFIERTTFRSVNNVRDGSDAPTTRQVIPNLNSR
jgi:hypothetical protein